MTPTSESRPALAAKQIMRAVYEIREHSTFAEPHSRKYALRAQADILESVAEELQSAPDSSDDLRNEVRRLRDALQQARDTRPNENYKVVTIDLEKVDALLGRVKP